MSATENVDFHPKSIAEEEAEQAAALASSSDVTEALTAPAEPPDPATISVTEVDALLGEADGKLTIADGLEIEILPIRTRSFLKLLRMVMLGGGLGITALAETEPGSDEFNGHMIALIMLAAGSDPDGAVDFVASVTKPVIPPEATEKERAQLFAALNRALQDPDLDDLMTILETVFANEKDNFASLGKRLAQMGSKPIPR